MSQCIVKYNNDGSIEVFTPQGKPSSLYREAFNLLEDQEKAFEVASIVYSNTYKELHPDKVGEPTLAEALATMNYISSQELEISTEDLLDVSDIVFDSGIKSISELEAVLTSTFRPNGVTEIDEQRLRDSGLYTEVDIVDILNGNFDLEKLNRTLDVISRLSTDEYTVPDFDMSSTYDVISFEKDGLGRRKKMSDTEIEEMIVDVTKDYTSREDFFNKFQELEIPSLVQDVLKNKALADKIYNRIDSLTPVEVIEIVNGDLVNKSVNSTISTINSTIIVGQDTTKFRTLVDTLLSVDVDILEASPEEFRDTLLKAEKLAINFNLDIVGVSNLSTIDALKLLEAAQDISLKANYNRLSPDSITEFAAVRDELLNNERGFETSLEVLDENYKGINVLKLYSELSNEKLFTEHGLIKIGDNLYHRVANNESIDSLYDLLYKRFLADSTIIPDGYVSTKDKFDPNNKTKILEGIKSYINTRKTGLNIDSNPINERASVYQVLFNHKPLTPKTVDAHDIFSGAQTKADYLTGDFVADFYKLYLREKQADTKLYRDVLSNFIFNNKDITVKNVDNRFLNALNTLEYNFPAYGEIRDYASLKKSDPINQIAKTEAPVGIFPNVDQINIVNNPHQLPTYKGSVIKVNNYVHTVSTDTFIKVNNDIYQRVGNNVFAKLVTDKSNNYYSIPVLNYTREQVQAIENAHNIPATNVKPSYEEFAKSIDNKTMTPQMSEAVQMMNAQSDPKVKGAFRIKNGNSYLAFTQRGNMIELASIYTPKSDRGQGQARQLISEFTDTLDRIGATSVLMVDPRDAETTAKGLISFYESVGYRPTELFDSEMGIYEMERKPKPVVLEEATFFSNAEEALNNIQDKNPKNPQGWMNTLTDVNKNGGIRNVGQELDWIGMEDFLNNYLEENNTKNIPFEAIQKYVNDNKIEVVEITKGTPKYQSYQLKGGENYREVLLTLPSKGLKTFEEWAFDNYGNISDLNENQMKIIQERYKKAIENQKGEVQKGYKSTHWDEANILAHVRLNEQTLPDGRRVLIVNEIQSDWAQQGRDEGFFDSEQRKARLQFIEDRNRFYELESLIEIEGSQLQLDEKFVESRKTLKDNKYFVGVGFEGDGKKYLYLEGKSGSKMDSEKADMDNLPTEVLEAYNYIQERGTKYDKLSDESEGLKAKYGTQIDSFSNREVLKPVEDTSEVPDMPYKKTDQWVGMAMRRVMQMAVQEGFDGVSLATGQQSADMYSLAKSVESISVTPNTDFRDVILQLKDTGDEIYYQVDNDGKVISGSRNDYGKMLDEYVGKEMSEKIMNVERPPVESNKAYVTLEGEDLDVGGEGMKTFYDKIVPKVLQKEASRFDPRFKKQKLEVIEFKGLQNIENEREGFQFDSEYNIFLDKSKVRTFDDYTYSENLSDNEGEGVGYLNKEGEIAIIADTKEEADIALQNVLKEMESESYLDVEQLPYHLQPWGRVLIDNNNYKDVEKTVLGKQLMLPITSEMYDAMYEAIPLFETPSPIMEPRPTLESVDITNPEVVEHIEQSYGSLEQFLDNMEAVHKEAREVVMKDGSRIVVQSRTVLDSFAETLSIPLEGTQVENVTDIADVFSIHRSPRIEKSHVVFVKDGKIVSYNTTTLGRANQVEMPLSRIDVAVKMSALKADSFYIVHNHPSGNINPSDADIKGTKEYTGVKGFGGHVILDSNKFALIDKEGGIKALPYNKQQQPLRLDNFQLEGKEEGFRQVANISMQLLKGEEESIVVMLLDSANKIAGFETLPADLSSEELSTKINEFSKNQGAPYVVLSTINGNPVELQLEKGVNVTHSINFDSAEGETYTLGFATTENVEEAESNMTMLMEPSQPLPTRSQISEGATVKIEERRNRGGALVEGVVKDILTNSESHPYGILVRLEDGKEGRVKSIPGAVTEAVTTVEVETIERPTVDQVQKGDTVSTQLYSGEILEGEVESVLGVGDYNFTVALLTDGSIVEVDAVNKGKTAEKSDLYKQKEKLVQTFNKLSDITDKPVHFKHTKENTYSGKGRINLAWLRENELQIASDFLENLDDTHKKVFQTAIEYGGVVTLNIINGRTHYSISIGDTSDLYRYEISYNTTSNSFSTDAHETGRSSYDVQVSSVISGIKSNALKYRTIPESTKVKEDIRLEKAQTNRNKKGLSSLTDKERLKYKISVPYIAPAIAKLIDNKGTADMVVRAMSSESRWYPIVKQLSTYSKLENISLDFLPRTADQGGTFKFEDGKAPAAHLIDIRKDSDESTLIHELVHGVSAVEVRATRIDGQGQVYLNNLQKFIDENKNSSDKLKNSVARLGELYLEAAEKEGMMDILKEHANKRLHYRLAGLNYGFTNLDEFIAESFSDTDFQDRLNNIKSDKVTKETLWDKFLNIISDLLASFGKAKLIDGNILKEVIITSQGIFESDIRTPSTSETATEVFSDHTGQKVKEVFSTLQNPINVVSLSEEIEVNECRG